MIEISSDKLASKSLHHPLLLTERAPIVLLDPELHATVMKRVVALTPHHCRIIE